MKNQEEIVALYWGRRSLTKVDQHEARTETPLPGLREGKWRISAMNVAFLNLRKVII
jgi:hypothetical protein